jgi:hypothetical protein
MFFRKKAVPITRYTGVVPEDHVLSVAELWDKESACPANCSNVAKVLFWRKIFEIFPRLKTGTAITISHANGLEITVSVSAADYSESPFNSR